MATLKCNSCGGAIASNSRRVQCPHCGELFPFACAHCKRKMRPPLSVFDDERHLTFDEPPLPLCEEHYLRKCPDCDAWFHADETPGYFRCANCRSAQDPKTARARVEMPEPAALSNDAGVATQAHGGGISHGVAPARSAGNPNLLVLGLAACAFVALVGWFLLKG